MKEQQLNSREIGRCLAQAGVSVPESALEPLTAYVGLLMRWNRVMNLVGASTWKECVRDLIADCCVLAPFMASLPLPKDPVIWDPGAGAGLPGIPLRILWQEGTYTMIEIRQKRAMFLSQALGTLKLAKTTSFCGDIAAYAAGHPRCDCVVSRAFMPWEKLLDLAGGLVKPHGIVVFMASDACPKDSLPAGWQAGPETSYPSGKDRRWLWTAIREEGACAPSAES